MKYTFYILTFALFLVAQDLKATEDPSLGLLAPKKQDYSDRTMLYYKFKIYDTAEDREPLDECTLNSYFMPKMLEKNEKYAPGSLCGSPYEWWSGMGGAFSTVGTSYEFVEVMTWGEKKNRYKVKLWERYKNKRKNGTYGWSTRFRWVWVEVTPPLKFSSYKERTSKEADRFTEDWDHKLYFTPGGTKHKKLIYPKDSNGREIYSVHSIDITVKNVIEKDGKTWLQIRAMGYDPGPGCAGFKEIPAYKGLWVPLMNEKGQYNVAAFNSMIC